MALRASVPPLRWGQPQCCRLVSSGASVQAGMGLSCTGPWASVTREQSIFIRVPWSQRRKNGLWLVVQNRQEWPEEDSQERGGHRCRGHHIRGRPAAAPRARSSGKTEIALFKKPGKPTEHQTLQLPTVRTRLPRRTRGLCSTTQGTRGGAAWGHSAGLALSLRFSKASAAFFLF